MILDGEIAATAAPHNIGSHQKVSTNCCQISTAASNAGGHEAHGIIIEGDDAGAIGYKVDVTTIRVNQRRGIGTHRDRVACGAKHRAPTSSQRQHVDPRGSQTFRANGSLVAQGDLASTDISGDLHGAHL